MYFQFMNGYQVCISYKSFMARHTISFVTMHVHHQNGEFSLIKGFMLRDSTYTKRQDFIVSLLLVSIIIINFVTDCFISIVIIITIVTILVLVSL